MKRLLEFFFYAGRPYRLAKCGVCGTRACPKGMNRDAHFHCFGILLNWRAFWVGAHYSEHHKRLCINLLPCVTVWWAQPGGKLP